MLKLFKRDGTPVQSFVTYSDLFLYIVHKENGKLFDNNAQFVPWRFEYLSPQRIAGLLHTLKKKYDEEMLFEAWRQGSGVIELCEGNCEKIHQVLITPNISVEALREDWCKDYCEDHGYVLSSFDDLSSQRDRGAGWSGF